MDSLHTREVARRGGVNLETIRYYERRGLLPRAPRTPSGYRAFSPEAVQRLRFVKRAQALGFSLKEIKELLSLRAKPKARCADVRKLTQSCEQADLVNQRTAWILWGGPAALLAIGAMVGPLARTVLWTPALSVAGAACVLNAARCHRLHCYLTGPLFLLGAAATVLSALDVVRIDWRWILGSMIVGTAVGHALERARGKYVGGTAPAGRPRENGHGKDALR